MGAASRILQSAWPQRNFANLLSGGRTETPALRFHTQKEKAAAEAPKSTVEFVDLPAEVRQRLLGFQQWQAGLISKINASVPAGCHVIAWQPLPISVFEGPLARFLMMACDFYPHSPANTMLFPAMPAGIIHHGMPRHPFVVAPAQLIDAETRIAGLRDKVAQDHARIAKSIASGDMSQFLNRAAQQAAYRDELLLIASHIAKTAFGDAVWQRHENVFRTKIDADS